jgi:diadenosine tetraphosphate (Ap4A) HIT family hydrolase
VAVNRNQNLLGKTMVVANRSVEAITTLSLDEWSDLLRQIGRVTAALDSCSGPTSTTMRS